MTDTLYESFTESPDNDVGITASLTYAQTFTPSVAHNITSVKLLLYRQGTPGTMYVEIRATSAHYPTGSALVTGSINANDFTTNSSGQLYEITFPSALSLDADTEYAIIARCGGDAGNRPLWLWKTAGGYAGGFARGSMDNGASWYNQGGDLIFYEYGTAISGNTSNFFHFF